MSYYLRGSDGDGFQGLGTVAAPVYEDCGFDAACIARNDAKEGAYLLAQEQDTNAGHLSWCLSSGYPAASCYATYGPGGTVDQTANAGQPVQVTVTQPAAQPAAQSAPSASGGHVTFSSSRGSNALQVGDTWLVSITGATPNSPVSVTAGGAATQMGTTDANGNFSLAGTARTQDVGTWNESWSVGGLNSGAFQFTIAPVSTSALQNATVPTPVVQTVPGTLQTSSTAGASSSSTATGFDLSSIPTWGWLAAAGVAALFLFKGGR